MSINQTNPDNPPNRPKPRKIDWDWRDGIISHLKSLGVPHTIAEVAVIDLRPSLEVCYNNKLKPNATAELLLDQIQRMYNKGMAYTLST